jgi:hypothetical protein
MEGFRGPRQRRVALGLARLLGGGAAATEGGAGGRGERARQLDLRRAEAAAAEQQRLVGERDDHEGRGGSLEQGGVLRRVGGGDNANRAVEGDQRRAGGTEQGPRLVEQVRADLAGRRCEQPRDGLEGRRRGVVVRGHPGVIGMRRGGFTLRPHPRRGGRVAEGTRLLSEYGAESSIAGSNPALSAPHAGPMSVATLVAPLRP